MQNTQIDPRFTEIMKLIVARQELRELETDPKHRAASDKYILDLLEIADVFIK